MQIRIEPHTLLRANERGASEEEIKETLITGNEIEGKKGRLGRSKIFPFAKERSGKYYNEKKLEVFFIIENETIVTITVYVFYGDFSNQESIGWEQTI